MLAELQIKNLALIEELTLSFSNGLTVLSGETGAGKTIIIEALNLLLGGRADSSRVRSGSDEAIVQGLFHLTPEQTTELTEICCGAGELLLSRKLSADGKSRCYLNGSLITVSQLAEVGSRLVDIHGQHEHQSLFRLPTHLEFLDQFAGSPVLERRLRFAELLEKRRDVLRQAVSLKEAEAQKSERRDLLLYQIREIDEGRLQSEEDSQAENELERMRHHERLTAALTEAVEKLAADESGALDHVQLADKNLAQVSHLDTKLNAIRETLVSVSAQLEEVTRGLRQYQEENYFDEERLNWLEDRVHLLKTLKNKYGGSLEAVFDYRNKAEDELARLENSEVELVTLEAEASNITAKLLKLGEELSQERRRAAHALEEGVTLHLKDLAMGDADFNVFFAEIAEPNDWQPTGMDIPEFFISPNKGEKMLPLAKIASGGEISRVMLALKTILAKVDKVPVMVFDEIDAGVGGKTASYVGIKLATLAKEHQIICVTHLPQIAVYADSQFHVSKTEKEDRTVTTIKALDKEERVNEITRMSGADDHSKTAVEHVRELIKAADREKAGVAVAGI